MYSATDVRNDFAFRVIYFQRLFAGGRVQPTIDDLGVAFAKLGIRPAELSYYVSQVEPAPLKLKVSINLIPWLNGLLTNWLPFDSTYTDAERE